MGNMLLRGFVHRHGRRIKIMKADGAVMKLRSPVSVKEILIDYPNHAIFQAPAGSPTGLSNFSRALPERAGLVAGHLYYLIPLPLPQDELIDRGHFARDSSSWLQAQPSADIGRSDSIKQEEAEEEIDMINIRGGVRTQGSTVRVKVLLRKKDVASFLLANRVNVVMGNVMVPPLIQRVSRQSPWKPRLDTITEPDSPLNADL